MHVQGSLLELKDSADIVKHGWMTWKNVAICYTGADTGFSKRGGSLGTRLMAVLSAISRVPRLKGGVETRDTKCGGGGGGGGGGCAVRFRPDTKSGEGGGAV